VADGTALHIGYNGVSDAVLISHVGTGNSQELVQYTTGYCRFGFSHSLGQEQTLVPKKNP